MDRLQAQVATLIEEPLHLVAQKRAAVGNLETTIQAVQLIGLVVGVFAGLSVSPCSPTGSRDGFGPRRRTRTGWANGNPCARCLRRPMNWES